MVGKKRKTGDLKDRETDDSKRKMPGAMTGLVTPRLKPFKKMQSQIEPKAKDDKSLCPSTTKLEVKRTRKSKSLSLQARWGVDTKHMRKVTQNLKRKVLEKIRE